MSFQTEFISSSLINGAEAFIQLSASGPYETGDLSKTAKPSANQTQNLIIVAKIQQRDLKQGPSWTN